MSEKLPPMPEAPSKSRPADFDAKVDVLAALFAEQREALAELYEAYSTLGLPETPAVVRNARMEAAMERARRLLAVTQ